MRSFWIRKLCCTTLCSFLVTFSLSQSLFATPNKEPSQKTKSSAEQTESQDLYLFVQGAHEATLSKNPAANQNDYLLALKNVNPYVTVFTERPARKTSLVPLKKYLTMWSTKSPNNFRQNPPNAAFHAIKKNAAPDAEALNYILELNTPKYNAATKTLTYNVKPLKGNTEPLPEDTYSLHHAILFIDDDVCLSCW